MADINFIYGDPNDTPIVGDWDGNGTDTIGIKRGNTYYLRNSNTGGVADVTFTFGTSTMQPVAGDWNGEGRSKIGDFEYGAWYLDVDGNGLWWDQINPQPKNPVAFVPHITHPHAPGFSSDGRVYSYDPNGNMTSDGERTFLWDYDNRPASITYGATTTFIYDGAGGRVKKIGPAGTIIYIDKLYELSGGMPGKYIFANGQRIALKSVTGTLYYHQDHLGSTGLVTTVDEQGQVVKVEDIFYKPFGESALDSGAISLNHKYTGQELDDETGLYNYRARQYNYRLARFISPDSIVPDYANPQSLNRYSYVRNNPLSLIDSTGHYEEWFDQSYQRGYLGFSLDLGPTWDSFMNSLSWLNDKLNTFVPGAQSARGAYDSLVDERYLDASLYTLTAGMELAFGVATLGEGQAALTSLRMARVSVAAKGSVGVVDDAAKITGASDDVVRLFHQGNLKNGQVSSTRALSTSMSRDLAHYRPSGQLYEFQVPGKIYREWMDNGLIAFGRDLHAPSGIISHEIRIMPPASGWLNQFLSRP